MKDDWVRAGEKIAKQFGIELGLATFIATNLPTKPDIFDSLLPYLKKFEPGHWNEDPMQMKQCFNNALNVHYESMGDFAYVEGVAVTVIPISHAWVTMDGIYAVDPTWKNIGPENCPYIGYEFTSQGIEIIDQEIKPELTQYLCNRKILAEICKDPGLFLSARQK